MRSTAACQDFLFHRFTAQFSLPPSRIQVANRICEPGEDMPMRPAGSESALKAAVDHEPRIDRVSERPKGRDEAVRILVELRVPVEFARESQSAANWA